MNSPKTIKLKTINLHSLFQQNNINTANNKYIPNKRHIINFLIVHQNANRIANNHGKLIDHRAKSDICGNVQPPTKKVVTYS